MEGTTNNELVGIIGAIGSAIVTPIAGVIFAWLNGKLNDLKDRLKACEEKWANHEAAIEAAKPK